MSRLEGSSYVLVINISRVDRGERLLAVSSLLLAKYVSVPRVCYQSAK